MSSFDRCPLCKEFDPLEPCANCKAEVCGCCATKCTICSKELVCDACVNQMRKVTKREAICQSCGKAIATYFMNCAVERTVAL